VCWCVVGKQKKNWGKCFDTTIATNDYAGRLIGALFFSWFSHSCIIGDLHWEIHNTGVLLFLLLFVYWGVSHGVLGQLYFSSPDRPENVVQKWDEPCVSASPDLTSYLRIARLRLQLNPAP
jgi:hypothetical protein